MVVRNTTTNRAQLIKEFLQGRSERVYAGGRMYTRESPDSDGIQLVAYGNEILAELEDGHIELYIGHHGQVSQTVTNYVKVLGSVLSNTEGLDVDVYRDAAPTVGYIVRHLNSAAAQYINSYVGSFDDDMSPVEEEATKTVEEALAEIVEREFGDSEE